MLKSSLNIGNQTSQKERPFIAIILLLLLVLPSEVFVIVKMADYLKLLMSFTQNCYFGGCFPQYSTDKFLGKNVPTFLCCVLCDGMRVGNNKERI